MDNSETLDDDFSSELHEDEETFELLDFALLEEDSITLLFEDDEILELLDFALLEDETFSELDDFSLLEEDFSFTAEDSIPYVSSSLETVGVEQAAKKAAAMPTRKILKKPFFMPEIYI